MKKVFPGPRFGYILDYSGWLIRRYAHLVGLDNAWTMFSYQSRFNWWYVIKAQYADNSTVILPLPRQSERSFWQKAFIDFKEIKFHLNMYPSEFFRKAYAHYLCRNYPDRQRGAAVAVIFELHWQPILPRETASRTGRYLHKLKYSQPLNEFICPGVSEEYE